MSDSDKPDTQALILKQLKSIKIALCLVVVIMLLLSGVIVVGGVVVGIASFSGGDEYPTEPATNVASERNIAVTSVTPENNPPPSTNKPPENQPISGE